MDKEPGRPHAGDLPGHYISPDQLSIGLYIHLDLGWMQHPFAFSNFKIEDEDQIRKIRALNLKKIRYDPNRSDVVPGQKPTPATVPVRPVMQAEPTPTPATALTSSPSPDTGTAQRLMRLNQLNEAILESEQSFSRNAVKVRAAVRNLDDHPEEAKEAAESLVKEMVNSVITESDVVLHSVGSKGHVQESFVHSLNVTVLALMLAKSLDMKEEDTAILGMAALFHDVGKEEGLKNKSFIDLHCEIGARIVQRAGLPDRVSEIILQHHEYMDGSGFPKRLYGEQIDPLARLLVIVNHYDNLCNPPNPANALTPYEALSRMYVTMPQKFNPAILKTLVKSLGVYPPGSVVQLSNGLYGIVLAVNSDKPLLPFVMVYMSKVSRETPVVIDLAGEKNLKIKQCLRPDQLPREVFDYLGPRKRISYYFLKKQGAHGLQADADDASILEDGRKALP